MQEVSWAGSMKPKTILKITFETMEFFKLYFIGDDM